MSQAAPRVLLTGATGYIGGRLLRRLMQRGQPVRCLVRRPESVRLEPDPNVELVRGDVLEPETLAPAFEGIETAYYLIHSLGTRRDFEDDERRAAENFARAARDAGVRRIMYLGGLATDDDQLSAHLRSRMETGKALLTSQAQVIEFRASIIIGSGSLSFELIRALVERLPVMICPRWVATPTQPIAVDDVLDYLVAALDLEDDQNHIFEIGGPDQVSYGQLMQEYARQRGLRRWMIRVPVLTPRLSSLWLGLVTPVYARVGRKLVDGLRNSTVVQDHAAEDYFDIQPRSVAAGIERALTHEDREVAETCWSDALSSAGRPRRWGGVRFGSRIVDSHRVEVSLPPAAAFEPIARIGGATGWYYANWLWRIRGWMDLLVGGVGLRRGRRDPVNVHVGDAIDFWRVEAYEPGRRVLLAAEMKVPGRAWLEFNVSQAGDNPNESIIEQTAIFDPLGLFGLAYWYALYPLHGIIFRGMLRNISRAAARILNECDSSAAGSSPDRDAPREKRNENG